MKGGLPQKKIMFICLSSGANKQYKDDIVRTLAVPNGTELHYRYNVKYLSTSVKDKINKQEAEGKQCLLAYLDANKSGVQPEIVPCRFGTVVQVNHVGTTFSFVIKAGAFAFAEDIPSFNQTLRSPGNTIAGWSEQEKKLKGDFCAWADQLSNVIESTELTDWEKVVTQLKSHEDFVHDPFYNIISLKDIKTGVPVSITNNEYVLRSSNQYEVKFYRYEPLKLESTTAVFTFEPSSKAISLLTNGAIHVNSRYDVNTVRFKTQRLHWQKADFISIYRTGYSTPDKVLDFDLRVTIEKDWGYYTFVGVLLGLFLGIAHIPETWANEHLTTEAKWWFSVLFLTFYVAAGITAAFGLNKLPE